MEFSSSNFLKYASDVFEERQQELVELFKKPKVLFLVASIKKILKVKGVSNLLI